MGSYPSAIVGLDHPNSSGTRRAVVAARLLTVGCEVHLKHEPENPHDRNAVSVYFEGHDLGYLPSRHASWVSERLEDGRYMRAFVESLEIGGFFTKGARRIDLLLVTTPADLPADVFEAEFGEVIARRDAEQLSRRIWPLIQAGTAILKHLAEEGGTQPEKALSILDDFLLAHLADLKIDADRLLLDNLRERMANQKSSRRAALIAADNFGDSQVAKAIFVDHARKMIMSDGAITAEEMRALKSITDKIAASTPAR